ncbi:hypothetical protein B0H14DRAFT_2585095 [Mycena olivaceomarginata]|nr:hypothetical protein B0H14DRAFT_2585095 [Mycena olivaceomarginata]
MFGAETQALCLFCSWRFATQDEAVLLGGAGDYYQIRRVTRDWSVEKLGGGTYTSDTLTELKEAAKQLELEDDGDWTEGKEQAMYGDPRNAKERQKTLNDECAKRARERAKRAEQFIDALKTPPSEDRSIPLFTNEALNVVHQNKTGDNFFESEGPEKYFTGDGPSEWSRVLQLGSDVLNQYMPGFHTLVRESGRAT